MKHTAGASSLYGADIAAPLHSFAFFVQTSWRCLEMLICSFSAKTLAVSTSHGSNGLLFAPSNSTSTG
jgi:hypothetical protein